MKRILVPLDQSPLGEAKLPVATEQARAFGAELILLHVLPREALDPTGAVSAAEARARTYLDQVAARMRAEGLSAHGLIRAGQVAPSILDEARERGVDLIVIGTNQRSTLPRAVLGSVADDVARDAPCPVLFVRPHMAAGAISPIRSFDDDAARTGPLSRRHVGLRTVDVSRIIGSVGRSSELDAKFRPARRDRAEEQRYTRIVNALEAGDALPPVELYKLGFGYYVLDGNHRVAAARELGQMEIDADVTEFIALGDVEAQRAFAERRAFERSTGLTRVEAAHSETYPRLQELIKAYASAHGLSDRREAARRWYGEVFRPLSRRIRQLRLASRFPGERSADIVVRVADYRLALTERSGLELDWKEALEEFADGATGDKSSQEQRRGALPIIGRA